MQTYQKKNSPYTVFYYDPIVTVGSYSLFEQVKARGKEWNVFSYATHLVHGNVICLALMQSKNNHYLSLVSVNGGTKILPVKDLEPLDQPLTETELVQFFFFLY